MNCICKNCSRTYIPNTDDSYKGFCSRVCKSLYEIFEIERFRRG